MSNDCPMTCATCRFYREVDYGYGRKPFMECDGPTAGYMEVSAADDTDLNASFQPPPQFSCSGWVKKD